MRRPMCDAIAESDFLDLDAEDLEPSDDEFGDDVADLSDEGDLDADDEEWFV